MTQVDGKTNADTVELPGGLSGISRVVTNMGWRSEFIPMPGQKLASDENLNIRPVDPFCKGYTGTLNLEAIDTAILSSWGTNFPSVGVLKKIDLKFDNCN